MAEGRRHPQGVLVKQTDKPLWERMFGRENDFPNSPNNRVGEVNIKVTKQEYLAAARVPAHSLTEVGPPGIPMWAGSGGCVHRDQEEAQFTSGCI